VEGEEVIDIHASRGVVIRVLASSRRVRSPAAVLLLPGDHGNLHIRDNGSLERGEINFLVRTRHLFQALSIATVLVDCPSDRRSETGLYGFRPTADHANDLADVAARAQGLFHCPVWLVGTSRGAESVVNAARRFTNTAVFSGGVLIAATTRPEDERPDLPGSIFDSPLSEITLPILIVHHARDSCHLSPCSDVRRVREALTNACEISDYIFDGGALPQSGPCLGLHAHGFFGIEQPVIDTVASYIKTRTREDRPWTRQSRNVLG